jgi:DNA-binding MarR family transcriptional regulator
LGPEELRGFDVLDVQVLIAVWLNPDRTVGEIAEQLALIPQTASKSLRRLQDAGLVVEDIDVRNRRARRQALTRPGRKLTTAFIRANARRVSGT